MNDHTIAHRPLTRNRRVCPPVSMLGSYHGDLDWVSLHSHIARDHTGERWSKIALDLGFGVVQPSGPGMDRHRHGRLYWATITGGVWHLDDFSALCRDTKNKRDFLHKVNSLSTLADNQIEAVPEDVLTLLVVASRSECFLDRQVDDLSFSDEITRALKDALPGQNLWSASEGASEHGLENPGRHIPPLREDV